MARENSRRILSTLFCAPKRSLDGFLRSGAGSEDSLDGFLRSGAGGEESLDAVLCSGAGSGNILATPTCTSIPLGFGLESSVDLSL